MSSCRAMNAKGAAMTAYYVDLGDGNDPIEVEDSAFTVFCGEGSDGGDAWEYTVEIERIERVHVRRSR